jgi:hypothetical protein
VVAPRGRLVLQTLHPLAAAGEGGYEDGWREEDFRGMGPDFAAPMPWYFRTVGSWVRALREAGFDIADFREPLHPRTRRPLSLLLIATPRPEAPQRSP